MRPSGRASRAATVVAALLFSPGAALAADPPPNGVLPGGVTYVVRADPQQTAAGIALWFRAPAAGFDATPTPGIARLAATTVAASTPITGTPLGRLVDRSGGRIAVAAYPDSVAVTIMVAPDRAAAVVKAMTADYFAPVTDATGLEAAQREVGDELAYRSYVPSDAIENALGPALFAAGPMHDDLLAQPRAIGAIGLDRVRRFAERAFRPANAVLVLTGNVSPALLSGVAGRDGAPGAPEAPPSPAPRSTAGGPIAATGNATGIGLGWAGPPITNEAAATALDFLADALFAPKTGLAQRAVAGRKAVVTGRFVTYRNPGVFLVTISGDDAAAVQPAVQAAVAAAAVPADPKAFAAARSGFIYRLLSEMQTPAEIADTYGWYYVEGAPQYAPAEGGVRGRYFGLAAALTPGAVAAAARTYLAVPPAVVTLATPAPKATPLPSPAPSAKPG